MINNILPKQPLTKLGLALVVLANPLLYLTIAATIIDIQNLFGGHIDRRSVSFNTNDPFIQAMDIGVIVGVVLIAIGQFTRNNKKFNA